MKRGDVGTAEAGRSVAAAKGINPGPNLGLRISSDLAIKVRVCNGGPGPRDRLALPAERGKSSGEAEGVAPLGRRHVSAKD